MGGIVTRTRVCVEELQKVAQMLTMRTASNEELRNAILYLIDGYLTLVQELDQAGVGRSIDLGSPEGAQLDRRPNGI